MPHTSAPTALSSRKVRYGIRLSPASQHTPRGIDPCPVPPKQARRQQPRAGVPADLVPDGVTDQGCRHDQDQQCGQGQVVGGSQRTAEDDGGLARKDKSDE